LAQQEECKQRETRGLPGNGVHASRGERKKEVVEVVAGVSRCREEEWETRDLRSCRRSPRYYRDSTKFISELQNAASAWNESFFPDRSYLGVFSKVNMIVTPHYKEGLGPLLAAGAAYCNSLARHRTGMYVL
jgi:hypothetical protein